MHTHDERRKSSRLQVQRDVPKLGSSWTPFHRGAFRRGGLLAREDAVFRIHYKFIYIQLTGFPLFLLGPCVTFFERLQN